MNYLIGEAKLNLYIFIARLQSCWKNKRWISEKEYEEIKRGN